MSKAFSQRRSSQQAKSTKRRTGVGETKVDDDRAIKEEEGETKKGIESNGEITAKQDGGKRQKKRDGSDDGRRRSDFDVECNVYCGWCFWRGRDKGGDFESLHWHLQLPAVGKKPADSCKLSCCIPFQWLLQSGAGY